jgi:response regulator RpfG family c-di-GMP phosphodiesterase
VLGHSLLPLLAGSALVAAALLSASAALFAQAGLFVSAGAPLLVVAGLFIAFSVMRLAIERQRARVWLKQLENARQVTIESMASVAETRDPETGAHIKRTQNYVRAIAEERSGLHQQTLTREYIDLLFISAPLHDIGKVGVPDHILLKPGRLTPDEMEQMKQHAEFGRRVIHSTAQRIDGENFLAIAGDIAATHHEKWDGSGYPHGLAGTQIPLAGRIMAVADIYDALISRRCYKEPFPHPLATSMMKALRGETFDPDVLDAFFRIEGEIQDIAARFKDEAEADTVKALRGSLQPA